LLGNWNDLEFYTVVIPLIENEKQKFYGVLKEHRIAGLKGNPIRVLRDKNLMSIPPPFPQPAPMIQSGKK